MGKAVKGKTQKIKTQQDKRKSKKNKPPKTRASSKNIKKPAGKKREGGIRLKPIAKKPETTKGRVIETAHKMEKSNWKSEIKDILLQMKKELLEDVSQAVKMESDYLRFDVGDFYDHASSDRDRELSLTLTDRERDKLRLIDEALRKIEDGSYGICESCGDEIGEDRLRAMPLAKLCLSCKIDLERQESRNI
jgi:RNA polymerase-binding transcription factor